MVQNTARGQKHQRDCPPVTSGLPRLTDIVRVGRHVSNVPNSDIQNRSAKFASVSGHFGADSRRASAQWSAQLALTSVSLTHRLRSSRPPGWAELPLGYQRGLAQSAIHFALSAHHGAPRASCPPTIALSPGVTCCHVEVTGFSESRIQPPKLLVDPRPRFVVGQWERRKGQQLGAASARSSWCEWHPDLLR